MNGKVYVGQTIRNVRERWNQHNNPPAGSARNGLFAAIKKYGRRSFEIYEVCAAASQEELNAAEKRMIELHGSGSNQRGYNIREGGGAKGAHAEITKERLRQSKLGKPASSELKAKLSAMRVGAGNAFFGRTHTAEAREKIAASHRGERNTFFGKPLPEETKKKIGEANRGRRMPPHVRELLAAANVGRKLSAEHRKKMSEARRGKPHGPMSEETKKKLSALRKGRPGNVPSDAARLRMSAERHGIPKSEETKEKLRQATLAYYARKKAVATAAG